jgi:transposase
MKESINSAPVKKMKVRKVKVEAGKKVAESNGEGVAVAESIGIDLGDGKSDFAVLGAGGEVIEEGRVPTTTPKLRAFLMRFKSTVVAIEVGTHSPWISRLIQQCGHEVVVANPRKVALISGNKKKNNRIDARTLAKLARVDKELLFPIHHRGEEAQQDLAVLRARDAVVRTRSRLITHVRGAVKSVGGRIPRCSAEAFGKRCREYIPEVLEPALLSIIEEIKRLTELIGTYDKTVSEMVERYPATQKLMKVVGVGELTALAYVLVIEDPERFSSSRTTGAYLGLIPGSDDTGDTHVQKRITKEGDKFLRRLLVSASQYILGPFGVDCDLRRHGEAIASRGGKNGKKRAVVAVARKLAVLLHKLWIAKEPYDPLYNAKRRAATDVRLPLVPDLSSVGTLMAAGVSS